MLLGGNHRLGCPHGHGPVGHAWDDGHVVRVVPHHVDADDGSHDALVHSASSSPLRANGHRQSGAAALRPRERIRVGVGSTGLVAFVVADVVGDIAADRPTLARWVAVACFVAAGLYQLTPLKMRCLDHCRSPLGHLMRYIGFRGPLRDVRAGIHHGLFCLGCCWALMAVMVAFGVMNVAAMVGLALVIAVEKHWRHGERFARVVGVVAVVWAVWIIIDPSVAPGLDPDAVMGMQSDGG